MMLTIIYCSSMVLTFNPFPESRRSNIGPVLCSLTMQLATQKPLVAKPSKP